MTRFALSIGGLLLLLLEEPLESLDLLGLLIDGDFLLAVGLGELRIPVLLVCKLGLDLVPLPSQPVNLVPGLLQDCKGDIQHLK